MKPVPKTLRRADDLVAAGLIPRERHAEIEAVAARYAVSLTADVAALIEPSDAHDPIARQFIPDPAELEPRLGQGEDGVRVAGPLRAGCEHAQGGTADLAANAPMDPNAQDIQDPHHGEGGGKFGAQVLQFQPDRLVPLGVQGEQLGREQRGGPVVQGARSQHDPLLQ